MREEHPIDQRFRDALLSAETQPPPSVWEGVKNGRRRRRGFVFWSRRRGLAIATLLVALGAGAYWLTRDMRDVPSTFVDTHTIRHPGLNTSSSTSSEKAVVEAVDPSPAPTLSTDVPTTSVERTPTNARENVVRGTKATTHIDGTARSSNAITVLGMGEKAGGSSVVFHMEKNPTPISPLAEPSYTAPVLDAGTVARLAPLSAHWDYSAPALTPVAMAPSAYVLPSGEWWVAAQVGWYDVRRQWSGANATLKDALNASEAWTSTIGVGALIGRTWRSGVGLSTGVEHERSEQSFRYVDRWTRVDQEITTSVVTLDTQVFVSNADTITTTTLDERLAEGVDRRSVFRIPLEGHWSGSWRRWSYGLGLGVAAEFTKTTSSRVLVLDELDGHITSVLPQNDELRDRYPTVFLGIISADLGYLLHEHWTIWASPAYMSSLAAFGSNAEVFAQPERLGLRLRLSYTFICPRTH